MPIDRRSALGLAAGALGGVLVTGPGRLVAQTSAPAVLTPEMFGAKGDGRTNDSAAFAALGARISQLGGGTISLRRTVYLVGAQHRRGRPGEPYAYNPAPLLSVRGCRRAVTIRGNGATLRAAGGLRFGTFDPASGLPTRHALPFTDIAELAVPYHGMVGAVDCSGPVTIEDLELDGNLGAMVRGGPFGDTGHQVPGTGLLLERNTGDETVRNVHSHHHVQDGIMIDGPFAAAAAGRTRRIEGVRCEYNGRQGCSVIGGRDYVFRRSRFAHTGRAGVASAPAAGVDIEAEDGRIIRNLRFEDCEFVDNVGCGMVADSGDSDGVQFERCTFVGTTIWSAWPNKPNFRFSKCTFAGAVVRSYGHGDPDPRRATRYADCTFTDDPALSPTGRVYLPEGSEGTIADVSLGDNASFTRCRFVLRHGGLLPWSWRAIYRDCTMEQRAATVANPKGRYLGNSTIRGPVDLYGTIVDGTLTVNGKTYASGTRIGNAPSDAEWAPPRYLG